MKLYDFDAGVILRAANISVNWLSGNNEDAAHLSKKEINSAKNSGRPFNIVYIHYMMLWWQVLLRNPQQALIYLSKFDELKTTDYELFHWSLHSKVFLGWAKAETGYPESGILLMKEGISELRDCMFIPDLPYYYGLLAEVLGNRAEFDEAESLIEEAIKFMDRYDVRFPEAEIYRTKGELLLKKSPDKVGEAVKYLKRAVQISGEQGAKLFENRAAAILKKIGTAGKFV